MFVSIMVVAVLAKINTSKFEYYVMGHELGSIFEVTILPSSGFRIMLIILNFESGMRLS